MYHYFHCKYISGTNCDVSFARRAFVIRKDHLYIKIGLITQKGTHMQNRRLYKNGNSYVLTLSVHQLNHIGVLPGNYIRVEMKRGKCLILSKASPKIQQALQNPS